MPTVTSDARQLCNGKTPDAKQDESETQRHTFTTQRIARYLVGEPLSGRWESRTTWRDADGSVCDQKEISCQTTTATANNWIWQRGLAALFIYCRFLLKTDFESRVQNNISLFSRMDAATQWKEEEGDSSHTFFEPRSELSPPPATGGIKWDAYPESTSSMFGEVECGEPMLPQRLILDFPLREDPDSEEAQQKVRAFWEFLEKHPELDNLVCGEEEQEPTLETISSVTPDLTFSNDESLDQQTTALSTLCLYETSGAIDRAFHTRMKNAACDLELPSYFKRTTAPLKDICVPDASSMSSGEQRATPSSEKLAELHRSLWTWDERHPKSMEPPGHPPPLIHAELLRHADRQLDDYEDTLRNNDPYNY